MVVLLVVYLMNDFNSFFSAMNVVVERVRVKNVPNNE